MRGGGDKVGAGCVGRTCKKDGCPDANLNVDSEGFFRRGRLKADQDEVWKVKIWWDKPSKGAKIVPRWWRLDLSK